MKKIFSYADDKKSLAPSKLKALADDKFMVTQNIKFLVHRAEKHCRKRRKCWLPACSPFPAMFSKGVPLRVSKIVIMW